jgi:hypothetical protein
VSAPRGGVVLLAVVFLTFHVRYLPPSLEDLDSINFALGIRSFDVAEHQPHPPGYPVFVLVGKMARSIVPSEVIALTSIGILSGTIGVFVLLAVYRRLDEFGSGARAAPAMVATLLAATSPLYWFTASRPLSDTIGLVVALAVQAVALGAIHRPASAPTLLPLAAFGAALGAGIRSQVVWLTLPLVAYGIARAVGPDAVRSHQGGSQGITRPRVIVWCVAAAAIGGLCWALPLVVLTGGPGGYWRALSVQGVEDFTGVQMLWTTPTPRQLLSALYYTFIAPWARWDVASALLLLAAVGLLRLGREHRAALTALAVAFGPYCVFDLLFQETFTTRYALPLVVPIAYLAGHGAAAHRIGVALAVAISALDAHVGGISLAAYAREEAPAFRLLRDMRRAADDTADRPVLAADRREALDLRRPILWLGAAMPDIAAKLSAPPKQEWLEAVKYWSGGGRAPVWFVVDPKRAQIDAVDHGAAAEYRWSLPYPVLIGGVRPNEMDWYRVDQPEWYVGEGWALSPELAGIAAQNRRGPGHAPIEGWVRRRDGPTLLMVGGRNLGDSPSPRVSLTVDGRLVDDWTVPPGFFLRWIDLPPAEGGGDYRAVRIAASAVDVAIEQFDAGPAHRLMAGFGDGWHELEYDAAIGRKWRWLSERGELRVRSSGGPSVLRLEGDAPSKYYRRPSRLIVRSGDRVLAETSLSAEFALDVPVPEVHDGRIVLETDQVFVPAERSRRTTDRRHLGLKIFKCRLVPAS